MKDLNQFKSALEVDESQPHSVKEDEGADDKEYISMMEMYKRMRRDPKNRDECKKMIAEILKLGKNGDVSKNAKIAAAYL